MNNALKLAVGTEFSSWLVISDKTKKINNITHWQCKCLCGKVDYVPLNNLMNGSSTQCQKCANKKSGLKRRKGCGDLSGDHWSQIKSKIRKKHPSFNCRIEEAWEQFQTQEGRCLISNREIKLSGYPYNRDITTAEYVVESVDFYGDKQLDGFWVCKEVAHALSSLTRSELMRLSFDIRNAFYGSTKNN